MTSKKVVAVIQARMGSSRLPSKVLRPINGKPMVEVVYSRVAKSQTVQQVVLATTLNQEDDRLVDWAESSGLSVFRGSENDVLSRFVGASEVSNADLVVRVTADDPLKDSEIIDTLVNSVLENDRIHYSSNTTSPSFPEGLDIEVLSVEALHEANKKATLASDREHVTPYLKRHLSLDQKFELINPRDLSSHRWTVDYEQDLKFMDAVFQHFAPSVDFSWKRVIDLVESRKEIGNINRGIAPRNEGYLSSLKKEENFEQ